jgi:hypothetical protein
MVLTPWRNLTTPAGMISDGNRIISIEGKKCQHVML